MLVATELHGVVIEGDVERVPSVLDDVTARDDREAELVQGLVLDTILHSLGHALDLDAALARDLPRPLVGVARGQTDVDHASGARLPEVVLRVHPGALVAT